MDVSGCGLGVKPELGLVSGSSSSSSSGGSLKETSSSSFPSSSLEIKLKSSLVSVDEVNINQMNQLSSSSSSLSVPLLDLIEIAKSSHMWRGSVIKILQGFAEGWPEIISHSTHPHI